MSSSNTKSSSKHLRSQNSADVLPTPINCEPCRSLPSKQHLSADESRRKLLVIRTSLIDILLTTVSAWIFLLVPLLDKWSSPAGSSWQLDVHAGASRTSVVLGYKSTAYLPASAARTKIVQRFKCKMKS
eukprot:6202856-Pleurochrysis_carterae.AAC.1